ncbi:hypothetical protein QYF61_013980 [Mycteria americana]|uniref:ribonuclease H n=1 Tax=Mycteria americana TaxID=33587 RepID=A0AAN7MIN5_MYCAM|nr:hypothetical protein QYF61_013980 [Mycteria americana]
MATAGRRARGGGEQERDVESASEDAQFRVLPDLTICADGSQKYKCTVKWAEREVSKSSQDLDKSLQAELEAEQKKRVRSEIAVTRLQNQLRDAFVRVCELWSELAEARREDLVRECGHCGLSKERELADGGVAGHYPWEEMERAKSQHDERTAPQLRPLIKTEFQYEGGTDTVPEIITKEIPYITTELAKSQDRYSRLPRETETEYVWRVSLTGGDRIKLSEEEAQGYWGPGVFLTVPDTQAPWSLTQRAAYWAGGLDPMERGDLVSIPTPGLDQITKSVQKAACLHLMHDRHLIPHQPSPMLLKANPNRMKPLIKGLPDPLKLYAIQIQDHLRAALPIQEHLTEMLMPGRNQTQSTPAEFPLTWGGVAPELINYSRNVGISRGEQRGYKHSPTLAHHALAQALAEAPPPEEGVRTYQYIDDVLIGGADTTTVEKTQKNIITHLEGLGLQIPVEKVQLPAPELKFLGIWWKGGTVCIPPETLTTLEQVRVPENKKELQHALGLLVFWRKHIPDFSIIARPLYDLTHKRAAWDWTPVHEEALKLLVFEAGVYQALGPIHPMDTFQIEWGFAIHGASIHIWQKGPEGPTRPLEFFSRSFKDAEKRYATWEKGLFVVTLALQEVGKIIRKQSIILRGPFKVLRPVLAGTPPPMGVAQRETVRKWYAQLEHYSHAYQVEEGTPRILQIQDRSSVPLEKEVPPTYIREAPPYEPQLKNVWFTDASSKREGRVWKYRAAALCVDSGGQIITEGEGSVQVGELVAVWSVVTREKDNTNPVYIYTDSYAVFKGCSEWLPFWEQNQWEVNRVPVWQKEKWEDILQVAKRTPILIGCVAAHQGGNHPTHILNNQVDLLTRVAVMTIEAEEEKWEHLLEWLHVKRSHSGIKDLLKEAGSRGWPVNREMCGTVISTCGLCRTRLEKHPYKILHSTSGMGRAYGRPGRSTS